MRADNGPSDTGGPRLLIVTTVALMIRSFLLPFACRFRRLGWCVDAAAADVTKSPMCIEQFDRVWDIPWSRNPFRVRNWLRAPRVLRQLVEEQRYDLVHVHSPVAGFVTRHALRRLRRQGAPAVIYTSHGFLFHRHGNALANSILAVRKSSLDAGRTNWSSSTTKISSRRGA